MLLDSKRMAFLGLLLAFAVLMVVLSGLFEISTLFLLAGASFCVGIAIRECNLRLGVGFFIASTILSLILAPNKLYCFTFAGMGLYLVMIEFSWEKLASAVWNKYINRSFWLIKWILFNIIYLPIIIFLPELVFPVNNNTGFLVTSLLLGQVGWIVYDLAYRYFQNNIWGKLRKYYFRGD